MDYRQMMVNGRLFLEAFDGLITLYENSEEGREDPLQLGTWIEEQLALGEAFEEGALPSQQVCSAFALAIRELYQERLVDMICRQPLREPCIERRWVWERARHEEYRELWNRVHGTTYLSPFDRQSEMVEGADYPLAKRLIHWISTLPPFLRPAEVRTESGFSSPLLQLVWNSLIVHPRDNSENRLHAYQVIGRLRGQQLLARVGDQPQERSIMVSESVNRELQLTMQRTQRLQQMVGMRLEELQQVIGGQLQSMVDSMAGRLTELETTARTAVEDFQRRNEEWRERLRENGERESDLRQRIEGGTALLQERQIALQQQEEILQRSQQEKEQLDRSLIELQVQLGQQELANTTARAHLIEKEAMHNRIETLSQELARQLRDLQTERQLVDQTLHQLQKELSSKEQISAELQSKLSTLYNQSLKAIDSALRLRKEGWKLKNEIVEEHNDSCTIS